MARTEKGGPETRQRNLFPQRTGSRVLRGLWGVGWEESIFLPLFLLSHNIVSRARLLSGCGLRCELSRLVAGGWQDQRSRPSVLEDVLDPQSDFLSSEMRCL